jgi:hypothetical protein
MVFSRAAFDKMEPAASHHQTVHAVMPREDKDCTVSTLSLTICLSLVAGAMLGLDAPFVQSARPPAQKSLATLRTKSLG